MTRWFVTTALVATLALGCGGRDEGASRPVRATSPALTRSDQPLRQATPAEVELFDRGDVLFETAMRPADGLGPLFIRNACASCHRDDGRGPGLVAKIAAARPLPYGNTERPFTTGGARVLLAPEGGVVTHRLPPAVFGRGYMEAVDDREIEAALARALRRSDGISGRINRVSYGAAVNPGTGHHGFAPGATNLIGRFGAKARIATLDEFTADAFQSDMGITSPLRPSELPNPDDLRDDDKPGVDVTVETVTAIAEYTRLLEIPERRDQTETGRKLFERALCSACHVPSMKTRSDYPIAALAGIAAPVFTDFLLHDMGEALADGITEGAATGRHWRTAPLMGLRFFPAYMHDGRARTIEDAIAAHGEAGSEARVSVERFDQLEAGERATLVAYVRGL